MNMNGVRNRPSIRLGRRLVSEDSPCYIIAEIGSNHNRDYRKALQLIDAAKSAAADAVKFQTFRAETLYSRYAPRLKEMADRAGQRETPFELIKRIEMPWEWHAGLKKYCKKAEIDFCSTPFDIDAVEVLEKVNVPFYKIASSEIDDIFLLERIAKTKKPIIVSTGKAALNDVRRTVNHLLRHKAGPVALLHCVSQYPAKYTDLNLKAIATLRREFKVIIGFSDHTLDTISAIGAVSLGARIIEKHITLGKDLPGPDHSFAMPPAEFCDFVKAIRSLEKAMGSDVKKVQKAEEESKLLANRSIHAAKDIPMGMIIKEEMLCLKRPALGISPWAIGKVIGKKAAANIKADQWITENLIY